MRKTEKIVGKDKLSILTTAGYSSIRESPSRRVNQIEAERSKQISLKTPISAVIIKEERN